MSSILLVDDDADWRGLWRGVLEDAGHDVIEAATGTDALACLGRDRVELVLLDLSMPETSGWDVLEAVRSGATTNVPPIVVVTSHAEESSEVRARELGAAAYVAKPVGGDDLVRLVGRVLRA